MKTHVWVILVWIQNRTEQKFGLFWLVHKLHRPTKHTYASLRHNLLI